MNNHNILKYGEWKHELRLEDIQEFGCIIRRSELDLMLLYRIYVNHEHKKVLSEQNKSD